MAYTTIKKPNLYFTPFTFTGSGSAGTRTGVGFTPDMFIHKNRDNNQGWGVIDVIRGNGNYLATHNANAEGSDVGAYGITTDGYTFPNGDAFFNGSGNNMAYWNWKAGGTGVSNTDGSITSTVSVNTTSGFSIVSYTGTGANATVGHGLNSLPGMVIVKGRNTTSTNHWFVFHKNSQSSYSASGSAILLLNANNAVDTIGVGGVWNNTSPTSSVFNIGTENGVNESGKDFIAYCFAEKQGFSKFGSYTGNGSTDGAFVYTGFKPAWVMVKRTDGADAWVMFDNKRNEFNPQDKFLLANFNNAESTYVYCDFLSNGFKSRIPGASWNGSGMSYIYMAFAEEPLVGDNPCTAR